MSNSGSEACLSKHHYSLHFQSESVWMASLTSGSSPGCVSDPSLPFLMFGFLKSHLLLGQTVAFSVQRSLPSSQGNVYVVSCMGFFQSQRAISVRQTVRCGWDRWRVAPTSTAWGGEGKTSGHEPTWVRHYRMCKNRHVSIPPQGALRAEITG